MDKLTPQPSSGAEPFNSAVEVGLRALAILVAIHPIAYGLQRLTVLDYLVVHSDDVPDGPPGLHPRTPYRAGELLLRRGVLEEGLLLYQSRGLVEQRFEADGVFYEASDTAAAFLDTLTGGYLEALRNRATWVTEHFVTALDEDLFDFVNRRICEWGAEFTERSILREKLA